MSSWLATKRVINSGFTNFYRNIWVSVAATSMVIITLFIISTIVVLYTLTNLAIQNSTDKVGVVTAYFNPTTTDQEIQNVRDEITDMPGVKEVDYTTKDQAKQAFEQLHQNEPELLATLNDFSAADNPIPASVAVKANSLGDYASIYQNLESSQYAPYFQSVRDNQKVIDKLHSIINFITRFGLLLAGIFMLVTIIVTFNTIRLTIYNRREEVEIMRLVGATNWYIRWPFLIEGILYALFATVITTLIVFGLLAVLSSRVESFLSITSLGTSLVKALIWKILLINFLASLVLGLLASFIAIRRYLRI